MKRFWTFLGVLAAVAVMVVGCSDGKKKSKKDRDSKSKEVLTLTKSQKTDSGTNMKQIMSGVMMYSGDYDDWTPASLDLTKIYVGGNTKVFIARFDETSKESSGTIGAENTTYAYLIAGIKLLSIKDTSSTPVLIEKPWLLPKEEDTIRVGYADGHVSEVKIKGVSKMSCSEVVKHLTKDLKDAEIVSLLLQNAEKEDKNR